MGTNYYVKDAPCSKCGKSDEGLHIGKSSVGWKFAFMAHDRQKLTSFNDWKEYLESRDIYNEYDEKMSLESFIEWVNAKQDNNKHVLAPEAKVMGTYEDEEGYEFFTREFS